MIRSISPTVTVEISGGVVNHLQSRGPAFQLHQSPLVASSRLQVLGTGLVDRLFRIYKCLKFEVVLDHGP